MSIVKGLFLTLAAVSVVACGSEKNAPIAGKSKTNSNDSSNERAKAQANDLIEDSEIDFLKQLTPALSVRTVCAGLDGQTKVTAVVSELSLMDLDLPELRDPIATVLGIQRKHAGTYKQSKGEVERAVSKNEIVLSNKDEKLTIDLTTAQKTQAGLQANAQLVVNDFPTPVAMTCKTKQSF